MEATLKAVLTGAGTEADLRARLADRVRTALNQVAAEAELPPDWDPRKSTERATEEAVKLALGSRDWAWFHSSEQLEFLVDCCAWQAWIWVLQTTGERRLATNLQAALAEQGKHLARLRAFPWTRTLRKLAEGLLRRGDQETTQVTPYKGPGPGPMDPGLQQHLRRHWERIMGPTGDLKGVFKLALDPPRTRELVMCWLFLFRSMALWKRVLGPLRTEASSMVNEAIVKAADEVTRKFRPGRWLWHSNDELEGISFKVATLRLLDQCRRMDSGPELLLEEGTEGASPPRGPARLKRLSDATTLSMLALRVTAKGNRETVASMSAFLYDYLLQEADSKTLRERRDDLLEVHTLKRGDPQGPLGLDDGGSSLHEYIAWRRFFSGNNPRNRAAAAKLRVLELFDTVPPGTSTESRFRKWREAIEWVPTRGDDDGN